MPRPLPVLPHQLGVFTTQQALACRWTSPALRHAVRSARVDRLWGGVYASPVPDDAAGRARRLAQKSVAAALTNPGAHVSHLGAAAVHGSGWWAENPRACVTLPSGSVTASPGAHVHRLELKHHERWRGGVVLVTSPARTTVDVGREFGLEAAVTVGDALLHRDLMSPDDLARALAGAAGRPGVRSVRELPTLLDGRSESVLESRSRFRMLQAGLPSPEPQAVIRDRNGRLVARVDFYWDEFGVVGEADGDLKYDERPDLVAERAREDRLRTLGLAVVRWRWANLDPFRPTARKITDAFARGTPRGRHRQWTVSARPDVVLRVSDGVR